MLAILLSGFAQPSTGGIVDQIVVIIEQDLGDLERVVFVALPDEVGGCEDGGAALDRKSVV